MTRRAWWGVALAIAGAAACGGDSTGTPTGTAQGMVTDTTGAALGEVTIILRVGATFVASVNTTAGGAYSFPGTSVGTYDVHILVPPAMQLKVGTNPTPIAVTQGGTATADFSLRYLPVSLGTHLQPVLSASCALGGCHGNTAPTHNMDLSAKDSTYTYTVNVASVELGAMDRIEPSNSAQSYLVHKINNTHIAQGGSGSQMPLGAPALPLQTRRMIARWVTEGALNN